MRSMIELTCVKLARFGWKHSTEFDILPGDLFTRAYLHLTSMAGMCTARGRRSLIASFSMAFIRGKCELGG